MKPIGSVSKVRGGLYVKISDNPCEWKFLHWIKWDEYNPDNPAKKGDVVVMINGKNDFSKEHLVKVTNSVFHIFTSKFGYSDNPDTNRINLKLAEVFEIMKKRGKDLNLVNNDGSFKDIVSQRHREYRNKQLAENADEYNRKCKESKKKYLEKIKNNPELKAKYKAKNKKRNAEIYRKLKLNPEKYNAYLTRCRERANEVYKKKKAEAQNETLAKDLD